MASLRVGPAAFRRLAFAALTALAAIVVTGGAVRLTSSGLGCPTWPKCTPGSLTAELSFHPMVEFANRVVSAAVGLVVVATVVGALRRTPRRSDLTALSFGLLAGYLGQAVLGGLTVVFHLTPVLVMAHFLLSMLLLLDAFMLWQRAGMPSGRRRALVRGEVLLLARVVSVTAVLVLVLGTVVTGTGPNSGALAVRRLPFDLNSVAQLHSDAVLFLTGVTVALAVVLRMVTAPAGVQRRCRVLLGLIVGQAAVGFAQYFLGLPRVLVGLHILGATLFWLATLSLEAAMHEPVDGSAAGTAETDQPSLPTGRALADARP